MLPRAAGTIPVFYPFQTGKVMRTGAMMQEKVLKILARTGKIMYLCCGNSLKIRSRNNKRLPE